MSLLVFASELLLVRLTGIRGRCELFIYSGAAEVARSSMIDLNLSVGVGATETATAASKGLLKSRRSQLPVAVRVVVVATRATSYRRTMRRASARQQIKNRSANIGCNTSRHRCRDWIRMAGVRDVPRRGRETGVKTKELGEQTSQRLLLLQCGRGN